ncbi:MAG: 2-iminoacetate synthase ThiH [Deltaproteobacteria bacterium]|nr:2-iminoacetate synthase ThiH [Deltaproteobacteria bacterium]
MHSNNSHQKQLENIISKDFISEDDFQLLISEKSLPFIEQLAWASRSITLRRFGKTISLYAPLYLSSYCINSCKYCGFNVHNRIDRKKLTSSEVRKELAALKDEGFRHVLLLTGEAPHITDVSYLKEMVKISKEHMEHVSIEVFPMSTDEYSELVKAGCDGVTIYQETYNRDIYKSVHVAGPKKDYDYRYQTPIRAARASMKSIGMGFLLGLAPWREEIIELYRHTHEVMKIDWRARIAVSFPRLRPHEGDFQVDFPVNDEELALMIFSLRIAFPDAELVMSTRESSSLRDGFIGLGITRMSAGSSTMVGGYSGSGASLEQFEIDDSRSPKEISEVITAKGFEPVWKDWDESL